MGVIISIVVFVAICIAITILGIKCWDCTIGDSFICELALCLSIIASLAIVAISIVCCAKQARKPTEIYHLEQRRESLVESYNEYKNGYDDDIAHAQTLKNIREEIANFNSEINENNYFCDNFFVNWFYIDCTTIEPITIKDGVAQ